MASGGVALAGSFAAGADGRPQLAPGEVGLAGSADGLGEFLLRGRSPERGKLDRHQGWKRRVERIGLGFVVLKGVGQAVGVGDEVGKGGSHHDHRRYLSRAGRIAWAMANSPPR
jgi:hypothetical protein